VGATGGIDTVTLTVDQLPAHSHGVNDPGHSHGVNDPGHAHPNGTDGTERLETVWDIFLRRGTESPSGDEPSNNRHINTIISYRYHNPEYWVAICLLIIDRRIMPSASL